MSTARKVLLDTNLLLLWVVAKVDILILEEFKRVRMFSPEDAELLVELVDGYPAITTPHVLSETSNFLRQAPAWRYAALAEVFQSYIEGNAEIFQEARVLVGRQEFERLGLTDAGLLALSETAVIVTADADLAWSIEAMGGTVVNFNHFRGK